MTKETTAWCFRRVAYPAVSIQRCNERPVFSGWHLTIVSGWAGGACSGMLTRIGLGTGADSAGLHSAMKQIGRDA
eukprot:6121766-Pyramimonas_sp.AAC.1